MSEETKLYGISAEFASPESLLAAATAIQHSDLGRVDVFSPLPIPGMDLALGLRSPVLGWIAAFGVIFGGCGCFGMMAFATIYSYPFIIAGRPLFSWPYYVIPSVAGAMLCGALIVFVAMLFLDRLPRLNHPVFNIDGFDRVTLDRLFIVVEARSEDFDPDAVERALAELPERPLRMQRVPR